MLSLAAFAPTSDFVFRLGRMPQFKRLATPPDAASILRSHAGIIIR